MVITAEMSDDERYEILKNRVITVPYFNTDILSQINANDYAELERIGKSSAFKILRKIGEDFGVFRDGYTTQDLDVEFRFSKMNLQESVNKQHGKFQNYARMMTVLDEVIRNAVGIETQRDRYGNIDSQLDYVYYLVSGFADTSWIIPVLLEVKTYINETTSSLYIAISFREIERSRILGRIPDIENVKPHPSPTSISVTLSEFLSAVNTTDASLLKYVPDGFLDDNQKQAKQIALKETSDYIERKHRQRYAETDDAGFVNEAIISYMTETEDENNIIFIFHKKTEVA